MAENPAEIPETAIQQAIDRLVSLLEPYRRTTQPKFHVIGNLPDDGSPCHVNFPPPRFARGGWPPARLAPGFPACSK
jgi:hypothetical protein